MIKHLSPISGIATFKDQLVATAGYDNQLIIWDAYSKKTLARFNHDHLVNQCSFNQTGDLVASSSSDYTARIWSLTQNKLIGACVNHNDDVEGIAFHPSQPYLATVSRDHVLRVFDFSGKLLKEFFGHSKDVLSVCWQADGETLITTSDDGTIRFWSYSSGKCLRYVDLDHVETDALIVNQDGRAYAGNDNGEIMLIIGEEPIVYKVHDAGIKNLGMSDDGTYLVSTSYDRTFKLWEIEGDHLNYNRTELLPDVVWPRSCAFLQNSHVVFTTFGSCFITYDIINKAWDEGKIHRTKSINGSCCYQKDTYSVGDAGIVLKNNKTFKDLGSLCNFIVAADEVILAGGQLGKLFNVKTGKVIYQHQSPLNCGVVFYKASQLYCIVGTYTGEGLIFKFNDTEVEFIESIHFDKNAIKSISCSKDEFFAVSASGRAIWVKIDDYNNISVLDSAHEKIANACIHIAGNIFASVSRDLKLRIWDNKKAEVLDTPHLHSIKTIAVSDDKIFIATGDYRGNVNVYDRANRSWGSRILLSDYGISHLTFDTVKNKFFASSYDGNTYLI